MDSVSFPKCPQSTQFVSDWPAPSVLDVIRPLVALPPLLQAFGRDTNKFSSAAFVEHRIIVAGPYRPRLDIQVCHRNLQTMPIWKNRRRKYLRPGDGTGRWTC